MISVPGPALELWGYGGRVDNLLPEAAISRLTFDASGGVWASAPATEVNPRAGHSAIWDAANARMVVYGGTNVLGTLDDVLAISIDAAGVVQTLGITPQGEKPFGRYGHFASYDPAGKRMLVFGGVAKISGAEVDVAEIWELTLTPGAERWRAIVPKGSAPPAPFYPKGTFTTESPPRLFVLGTVTRPAAGQPIYLDRMWQLTLAPGSETWSELTPPDFRPRPRVLGATSYDPIGNRIFLSGGFNDPVARSDLWVLTLP